MISDGNPIYIHYYSGGTLFHSTNTMGRTVLNDFLKLARIQMVKVSVSNNTITTIHELMRFLQGRGYIHPYRKAAGSTIAVLGGVRCTCENVFFRNRKLALICYMTSIVTSQATSDMRLVDCHGA